MHIGVVIEETWGFFQEIYTEFQSSHQTSRFKAKQVKLPALSNRINPFLYRREWNKFLTENHVVFFEWASDLLAYASKLPKTCGIITRLHRYELYRWANKINWANVDRIILVSQAKRSEFSQLFPEHASKVVVIPEAISLSRFQPSTKIFNGDLGILCHLKPRKRVYELILAFYELLQVDGSYHLHIGGARRERFEDYHQAIQSLVKRLNLENKVTFYGPVDEPEKWYQRIDIFISNSFSEGLQVSPMEAVASGCFCLSHAWDGADELLPAEDVYLTDGELVAKVLEYTNSTPEERRSKREMQYQRVQERFDINKIKLQIRELAEEVGSGWVR